MIESEVLQEADRLAMRGESVYIVPIRAGWIRGLRKDFGRICRSSFPGVFSAQPYLGGGWVRFTSRQKAIEDSRGRVGIWFQQIADTSWVKSEPRPNPEWLVWCDRL